MFNWRLTLLLLLALVSTGCQSFDLRDRFSLERRIPWKRDEKEFRQGVPTRVIATWTDAVLHKAGDGAERGFGGRLYFYDNKGGEPIEVEGRLVVYAFDESGRDITDNRPTKRYVFPPDRFKEHKSEAELGVSYSVWLPWDSVRGSQTEVSLIARFEPVGKGNLIVSDQTRQRLHGQMTPGVGSMIAQEPAAKPGVQRATVTRSTLEPERKVVNQISYETPRTDISPPSDAAARMTTTTISLPNKFRAQGELITVPGATGETAATSTAPPPGPTSSGQSTIEPVVFGTQVSYLTPGESVQQSVQGRSFGSPPATPPAPATPASP